MNAFASMAFAGAAIRKTKKLLFPILLKMPEASGRAERRHWPLVQRRRRTEASLLWRYVLS